MMDKGFLRWETAMVCRALCLIFVSVAQSLSEPLSSVAAVARSGAAGDASPVPEFAVGGTLSSNSVWSAALGPIQVLQTVTVPSNHTLTVLAGTVIQLTNGVSIRALTGGRIELQGTYTNPVRLRPMVTNAIWGELSARGSNAVLIIRHAEVAGGQTTLYDGASGLLEDSFFHDYNHPAPDLFSGPILLTQYAAPITVRRCRISHYYETLFRNTLVLLEDSLLEDMTEDGLDFDAAPPGTRITRCTFRRGLTGGIDGVDVGNDGGRVSVGVVVEGCRISDFPFDKGVSIGDGSRGTVVRDCLIYRCDSGIAVKDQCDGTIYNCTLASNRWGLNLKSKYPEQWQGGRVSNAYNNVIWYNAVSLLETNHSFLALKYSDVEQTNYPGVGNINRDPLFMAVSQDDYRLQPASPCRHTGAAGADMGAPWPVGAHIATPLNLVAQPHGNAIRVEWSDASLNEAAFVVERAVNGGGFAPRTTILANQTDFLDEAVVLGHTYTYRVRGVSVAAESDYSNSATTQAGRPLLVRAALCAGTPFRLQALAPSNRLCVLESSSNLGSWTALKTNSTGGGLLQFWDAAPPQRRFYRLRLLP